MEQVQDTHAKKSTLKAPKGVSVFQCWLKLAVSKISLVCPVPPSPGVRSTVDDCDDGNVARTRNKEDQIRKSLDSREPYRSHIYGERFGPFRNIGETALHILSEPVAERGRNPIVKSHRISEIIWNCRM